MFRTRALSVFRPFALLAALALAAFAGLAPTALANDTPGNNGTVKIHDGPGETEPGEVRNEPHVCAFHLHLYFADPEQAGTWEIQEWAPTGAKGTVVLSGTYDTAGDGEDRQPEEGVYTLPDGHYKLFWDGDLDTGKHDKMKVFWVDCAPPAQSPVPAGSELPVASSSTSPSQSTAPGSSTPPASSTAPGPSTAPGGGELPIAGSPAPTGEVEGITGTPPSDLTPPPTDTLAAGSVSTGNDWRLIVAGMAALLAALAYLVPARASVGQDAAIRRLRR